MSVSPIGASSIQSLDLFASLSARSGGATTSASGSGDATDTLTLSLQAQMMSGPQRTNPFQADLQNLGGLIQSGDLDGARKAYGAMQARMQAHRPDNDGDRNDAVATGFDAIGKALDAGDTATAQKAYESLQTQLATLQGAKGSGANPFQQDLSKLGQLLDSGDLQGAKDLYQTMQSNMKSHPHHHRGGSGQGTEGSSGSASSAAASGTTGQPGSFSTDFAAIGTALASGDLSGAKDAWSKMSAFLQQRDAGRQD